MDQVIYGIIGFILFVCWVYRVYFFLSLPKPQPLDDVLDDDLL